MATVLSRSAVADVVRGWAARPGRAVVLDFNGTLSDDEPVLEEIFTEIFAQHLGWDMSHATYRRELLGHSDREIVEHAVRHHGSGDPGVVEMLLSLRGGMYRSRVSRHSPITAGARDLVRRLAAEGVPLAIVTGAQRDDVDAALASSGIADVFGAVVTLEDVWAGKPDPEGFLLGASLLGVAAADVLVFEDSLPGVRGARAAGMACLAVVGDDPDPAVLAEAPAAVEALSPDLLDLPA